eukprot:TRINITY_DN15267_c0_g1_i1.p1 TRINITY_DN15267_c0_g1~~TRINITY_DN15267_c0_g1_i1.p1  ORF type:complete len:299 (-),score=31.05 TRINITY_DN15267_c0_g1_i1:161-1057(-)
MANSAERYHCADASSSSALMTYLECSVCLSFLDNPMETPCGHCFCQSCVYGMKQRDLYGGEQIIECPTCRHHFPAIELRQACTIQRMLDTITVLCKHRDNGCRWTGPRSNLKIHETQCKYANVEEQLIIDIKIKSTEYDDEFSIPLGTGISFVSIFVDWGDGETSTASTGYFRVRHEYSTEGEYTVRVLRVGLPDPNGCWLEHFGNSFGRPLSSWADKVTSIRQLGKLGIKSLRFLFANATAFNIPLNHLDVSGIDDMKGLFRGATVFNQPLGEWNVANVTSMNEMFANAAAFDQNIG